jgi:CheY-like chemotaxis protein
VKNLVEAHGGSVTAQSPGYGQGATFTVRLPMVDDVQSLERSVGDLSTASTEEAGPAESLAGISVLVVDDDEETRHVVAAHLECHRADVLTAASVREAFDVLERERVDVLLADIAMPGEDGYALIRRLRALHAPQASIPAAALTAFARDEDRRRAIQSGFQRHLAKPIDERTLVGAVASLAKAAVGHAS